LVLGFGVGEGGMGNGVGIKDPVKGKLNPVGGGP
jgi:hypothetical protein